MNSRQRLILCLALILLILVIDPAFSQVVGAGGGGGTGLLNTAIQWVVTNIVQGLIAIAILVAGAMLMLGRHTLLAISTAAVGALVIANYQTIAGFFAVGGGG